MTKQLQIETVKVCNTEVQAVKKDGEAYVVLRRMCENLNIDTDTQRKKLASAEWATTVLITVVADDGKQRELFCLSIKSVPMWLSGIDVCHVSKEAKERITEYQNKASDILYKWATGQSTMGREELVARAFLASQEIIKEKDAIIESQARELEIAAPKVIMFDETMDSTGLYTLSDVAKEFKIKPHVFCKWLDDEKIRGHRFNGDVFVYQQYLDNGYFETKSGCRNGYSFQQPYITQKGKRYLFNRINKLNQLVMFEQ